MASIIKRCDCGDWDGCPHPWVVRYRTTGGRSSRQREQSFGDDLREAEDFALKIVLIVRLVPVISRRFRAAC